MLRTVTIPLAEPIIGHGDPVRAIVLREPTFDDYLEIGDPYEIGESEDKVRFTVQSPDAVRAYIERCMVAPKDPLLLSQAPALVGRKVRLAILDFFRDGEEAPDPSKTSPTS